MIVYPERLAQVAAAVGRPGEDYVLVPADNDHEDLFGESNLLSGLILPGVTVVTSFLDPDQFAQWLILHEPVAAVPRWIAVVSRHHRYFMTHAFLGLVRYLREIGADVRCVLPSSDAIMKSYYETGEPRFAEAGVELEVVEELPPVAPVRILAPRPTRSTWLGLDDHRGVEQAQGVASEVIPLGCEFSWLGLPCSIPSDCVPSIVTVVDWFRPSIVFDFGTGGYGSTVVLCVATKHFRGVSVVVVEEASARTRVYEKKLLSSSVSERVISFRTSPSATEGIVPPADPGARAMVLVGEDRFTKLASEVMGRYDEVLVVGRNKSVDVEKIVRESSREPSARVKMGSRGWFAVVVRR